MNNHKNSLNIGKALSKDVGKVWFITEWDNKFETTNFFEGSYVNLTVERWRLSWRSTQ